MKYLLPTWQNPHFPFFMSSLSAWTRIILDLVSSFTCAVYCISDYHIKKHPPLLPPLLLIYLPCILLQVFRVQLAFNGHLFVYLSVCFMFSLFVSVSNLYFTSQYDQFPLSHPVAAAEAAAFNSQTLSSSTSSSTCRSSSRSSSRRRWKSPQNTLQT